MKYFLNRLREPSSWGGLAAIILGVGQLGKINEAPAIAEAVTNAGSVVSGGGDPMTAGALLVAGLASVFMGEKGGDK